MIFRLSGALLMLLFLLAGCGGSSEGESYGTILRGLKQAAGSHSGYDAIERAKELKPVQRASIDAFCETNHILVYNHEAWKASDTLYYVIRIREKAEINLPFVSTHPVKVAVGQYSKLFGLGSFEPADVRSYAKACYA
jgi:hypothetical protein